MRQVFFAFAHFGPLLNQRPHFLKNLAFFPLADLAIKNFRTGFKAIMGQAPVQAESHCSKNGRSKKLK
jgi:hypothetical protein